MSSLECLICVSFCVCCFRKHMIALLHCAAIFISDRLLIWDLVAGHRSLGLSVRSAV